MLFVEIKTLNLSFNPVATWHAKCVPNLAFAYALHTLVVHMCAYYHEQSFLHTNVFQYTLLWNDYGECWEALVRVFLLCC